MHTPAECLAIVDAFIAEPFSNDERHVRRIGLISQYENNRSI